MSASKLKKIQGKELKNCFTNCKLSKTITDGRLMAINDQYLALAWDTPGLINMVDSGNPCNLNKYYNLFSIEDSYILDMEFSPFDSNILSFSNENKNIYVAKMTGNNEIDSGCYKSHSSKVFFINFNPVASNVVCSSTLFGEIHIWDTVSFKRQLEYKFLYNINSILWNPNGSLLGISTSNKLLTIIDPRDNTMIFERQITETNLKTKFLWLDELSFASIGKKNDKKLYLEIYDIRNSNANPVTSKELDSNSSYLTPFIDPELKIIYIIEKDDCYTKLYDYSSGKLQNYGNYKSTEINNFSIQLSRKYLDKGTHEIDRFARYTKSNKIYYVSFILNEGNMDYNELYYPNEESKYPQMTYEEWYRGNKTIPYKIHNKKKY